MITKVLQDSEYQKQQINQIKDQLMLLVGLVDTFSITANINAIKFDPDLPDEIKDSFSTFTLFSFANYTFESIILTEEYISFEAGFGEENMGSVVTIPYIAIFQIIIDESILFINPSATMVIKKEEEIDQKTRSMNAFTLNAKNKNLLD
ncbi:MAG: hypothetical protein HOF69_03475 [Campylobacteraceae bacterium]|jgi:hypothetical protein|nr:hypothetical protein [Campylobacteraceae bacterium]MBT3882304.1 hypothetical protein [Campylobacteraceae bacterium]MBT4030220.1 hypothetical protein [Campylobacteraceae bacterium]MBT4179277.1 hypothetical protein [Campylobacteraceae bacterium]MBT4572138.1 hypothetical protein [Campylobacteraceae bacterium]